MLQKLQSQEKLQEALKVGNLQAQEMYLDQSLDMLLEE